MSIHLQPPNLIERYCGCLNGGVCVAFEEDEICLCPSGYYGPHCENSE